jgi:hypothetical protein
MAGNGITITNSTDAKNASIGIKINTIENENDFLTVDANGLKLTGVNTAISLAANDALETAINTTKNQITLVDDYIKLPNGVNTGDIGIIKTNIVNDKWSYTAYVWNGTAWEAMDGNYNAENIYFSDNIMVTKEIGYITLTNGNGTIPSKGKNLVEVFDAMFTKEQDPSKTDPSVSITLDKAGSYEVGTTVTGITCTVSFNDGAYSYGPEPTGAEVNSWEIKDSNGQSYNYSVSAIGIDDVLVTDGINYTITAKANHSVGKIPKTNKGNNCTDATKRIADGTKSKTSAAITGYRYAFAGGTKATTINSLLVRGMDAKSKAQAEMNAQNDALEFIAHKGDTKVFFAYPSSWSGTPQFEIFGLAWSTIDDFVAKTNIQVADARGGSQGTTAYKLYVWEPGGGALTADETKFRVWFE